MKKTVIFASIGILMILGIIVSYNVLINYAPDNQMKNTRIKSFITESNEQYRDQITPQRIHLNNTIDTIEWLNLSSNVYTIVVDDSSNTRENTEHVFVSELLHKGDSAQFTITKSGTYVTTFVEKTTSRGWVNLLPSQDILVDISD